MSSSSTNGLTLFDLDGTLLPIDSDYEFGEFMVRIGWADGRVAQERNEEFFRQYQAGALDIHAYIAFATAAWRDRPPAEVLAARERFMREVVGPVLHEQAQALVRAHQEADDTVAIITSTNEFITRPIADVLGVAELIATQLACDASGRVTGAIAGTPSYREGKIARVHGWLAARGQAWEHFDRVTVYSDSMNDLPLLEQASDPVATNPTPALEALAVERGWRVLKLF